ncbi:MAG: hypothetical protein R2845_08630 [Thermomicrobiales bacterium]
MTLHEDQPTVPFDPMEGDTPHEECGVFGIMAPGEDVARLTFFGLYALQHRGQESAGIASSDGDAINAFTHLGLVSQAFREEDLKSLDGDISIGHTQYSTTGSNNACNAGPMLAESDCGRIAVSHSSNLVNASNIRNRLIAKGETFESTTDSEVLTRLIALSQERPLSKVQAAMPQMDGAYSLCVMTRSFARCTRSPRRATLCLGKFNDNWVIASESCALMTIRRRVRSRCRTW